MGDREVIKEWADEVLGFLNTAPSDTTPERITENRKRFIPIQLGRGSVSSKGKNLGVEVASLVSDAVYYVNEYFRYFEKGYKSPERIDDLPDKCKEALGKLIVEIDK